MNLVMKIKNPTGEIYQFVPKSFDVLKYDDLLSALVKKDKIYHFKCNTDSVEVERDGIKTVENKNRASFAINFREPLRVYALVDGGWLPPPFMNPPNLLADSNVIGYLAEIAKGNAVAPVQAAGWWFKLVTNPKLLINPLPYVFEGNQRRTPTFEELKQSYAAATKIIKENLPHASVVEFRDEHFHAAYDLLADLAKRDEKETEFLIKATPLVADGVPTAKLLETETEILKTARDLGVQPKSSLAVLSLLSCLYDDGRSGYATARKVIKPRAGYNEENAYNALADLGGLRLFLGAIALSRLPEFESFAFCTFDQAIALLWCGFGFHKIEFNKSSGLDATYIFDENLFPRLDEAERKNLTTRLI